MKPNSLWLIRAVLFVSCQALFAQTHSNGAVSKVDYKLGQVWTTSQGITVTILAIEDFKKVGTVVHVRVDNIPWQSCGDVHLTRTIEHIAVTEKMMMKSDLVLSKESVDLPQSSIEAYREWQGKKKHEIAKAPLPAVIQAQGYVSGPGICDPLISDNGSLQGQ